MTAWWSQHPINDQCMAVSHVNKLIVGDGQYFVDLLLKFEDSFS